MTRSLLHALAVAALLPVSVAAAVCGAFVHLLVVRIGPVPLPVGLVLAVGGAAAVLLVGNLTARSRWGSGLVATAWVLTVLLLSLPRPEGDLVIAQDVAGVVFVLAGVVLAGVSVGLPAGGLR